MLAHLLQRLVNIKPTMAQCLFFESTQYECLHSGPRITPVHVIEPYSINKLSIRPSLSIGVLLLIHLKLRNLY